VISSYKLAKNATVHRINIGMPATARTSLSRNIFVPPFDVRVISY